MTIYYHGCLEDDVDTILSEGLRTDYGLSARLGKDRPSIYLSGTPSGAGRYGDVVLKVVVPDGTVVKGYGEDYIIYEDVPPENITVYGPSGEWKSLGYDFKKRKPG